MKRWGLYTISNLWLLGAISATALAETGGFSTVEPFDVLNNDPIVVAQVDTVLEFGSTGTAVKDVQAMLSLMGYYSGAVDGTYGEATVAAVKQFQADAGINTDGVVGPATWQRLLPTPAVLAGSQKPVAIEPELTTQESAGSTDIPENAEPADGLPVLQLDDSGPDVVKLQDRLAAMNLYTGTIDGVFGLQTEEAVKQFQRQAELAVDGIVGPATWIKLLQ